MAQRITWVDLAKGLTILLVVCGHVLIGLFDAHIYQADTQRVLLVLVQAIYLFHMPVFFALSGFFFTAAKDGKDVYHRFKKRLISFGIPYLVFSFVLLLLFQMGKGSVRNHFSWLSIFDIWQQPIGPLWFLYVLFFVIIVNSILSLVIKDIRVHLGISLSLAILSYFVTMPTYIIPRLLVWSPFFLLGAYLHKYPIKFNWYRVTGIITVVIAYFILWIQTNPTGRVSYKSPGLDSIIMILAIIFAFMIFPKLADKTNLNTYFNTIGQNSLGIYLVHVPVVSVTRILLLTFGVNNVFVHIVIGLFVGWFGTLAILKYTPYIDVILYPTRFISKKR